MADATRQAEMPRSFYVGRYSGTTAAQKINFGFKPALVIGINWTDGDKIYIWSKHDTSNIVTIDTEVAAEAVAVTQVDDGTNLGISLPSNASVNEDAKVYLFLAYPE